MNKKCNPEVSINSYIIFIDWCVYCNSIYMSQLLDYLNTNDFFNR